MPRRGSAQPTALMQKKTSVTELHSPATTALRPKKMADISHSSFVCAFFKEPFA